MLEDKLLVRRFKQGRQDAFARIYEKYKDYLLTVATALLNDVDVAEDVVHSVFVCFAEIIDEFELTGSLKRYLAICTANRVRNVIRARRRSPVAMDEAEHVLSNSSEPKDVVTLAEDLRRINDAMAKIPYEQREVVTLHLKAGMKFREIARLQNESVNTIQSRYSYGLEKVRSLLDAEVLK